MGGGRGGFQEKMSFEPGTSSVMGSHRVIWETKGDRQRKSKCKGPEVEASPVI